MTPEAAKELLGFLLPQVRQEFETTRRVLAAVPEDRSGYKPSERCMSALELASHIALSEAFFLRGVLQGVFERQPAEFKSPTEAHSYYEQNVPGLIAQIGELSGAQLALPITFAIWTEPAVTYLNFSMKHIIHHRGQLSAYLRPMGAKVPSIYGPSADEQMQAASGR